MNENNKNEYVTRVDLKEQTQILLSASDKRLNQVKKGMNQMEDRLRIDINNVQTLIDGYVKAQEDLPLHQFQVKMCAT